MSQMQKTGDDLQIPTRARSAILGTDAPQKKDAPEPTTKSRNSITLKNTRPSTARHIPIEWSTATMGACVHSPTTSQNSRWIFSKRWHGTPTSTYSTTRLCGALSAVKITSVNLVSMHTIGKTSAANHIYLITGATSVKNGRLKRKPKPTKTDANSNIAVPLATAGRNKSTTRKIIEYRNVVHYDRFLEPENATKFIVLITIAKMNAVTPAKWIIGCFQKITDLLKTKTDATKINSWRKCLETHNGHK